MAKWSAVLAMHVLGSVLAASMVPATAQETRPEDAGQERRPIPLPEQPVTAPWPSPYVSPNESRTGTPLMDAPESITIVPRAIIDDQKAFNLEDVLRNVAGVARQAGRGFNDDFLIRGFRPAEGSMILRDQFPQAIDDLSPPAELWNVDRVEVLKGPNAFLYGRSEPGGIINLVTKKPLLEPRYLFEFDIGSFNLYRPAFDVTGPVPGTSDHLLYRLNGLYETADSFRDVVNGQKWFVAPALVLEARRRYGHHLPVRVRELRADARHRRRGRRQSPGAHPHRELPERQRGPDLHPDVSRRLRADPSLLRELADPKRVPVPATHRQLRGDERRRAECQRVCDALAERVRQHREQLLRHADGRGGPLHDRTARPPSDVRRRAHPGSSSTGTSPPPPAPSPGSTSFTPTPTRRCPAPGP